MLTFDGFQPKPIILKSRANVSILPRCLFCKISFVDMWDVVFVMHFLPEGSVTNRAYKRFYIVMDHHVVPCIRSLSKFFFTKSARIKLLIVIIYLLDNCAVQKLLHIPFFFLIILHGLKCCIFFSIVRGWHFYYDKISY